MLTTSVLVALLMSAMATEDTCKYEFNVPNNGGCVVHTKQMELSYEQMKADIATGHERTNSIAESFTKEVGILHQLNQKHQEHLDKLTKQMDDATDTLKSLPQITQELAEVSKALADEKRKSVKLSTEHVFNKNIDKLTKITTTLSKNITELATEMAEHRISLMSYGVTIDKMKTTEDNQVGLQEQMNVLKKEFQNTRSVISDLNEKVFSMEASVKSTTAAMASLGRLPGLVQKLQEQIVPKHSRRR